MKLFAEIGVAGTSLSVAGPTVRTRRGTAVAPAGPRFVDTVRDRAPRTAVIAAADGVQLDAPAPGLAAVRLPICNKPRVPPCLRGRRP